VPTQCYHFWREREDCRALAHKRASEINGYIYGERENGGTSTFYVSPAPFERSMLN